MGEKVKSELRRILESICRWKHWEILELNIQEDHIHLCMMATPRDSIRKIICMDEKKDKTQIWIV